MKAVTAAQMQTIDRRTMQERGVPGVTLMERAGRIVAIRALELFEPESVAVVTGKGNNAGDGFVIARTLATRGVPVHLFMLQPPTVLTGDALGAYESVPAELPRTVEPSSETLREALENYDLVVDAIFGTGVRGAVRAPWSGAIEAINACGVNVLAVDIPSGLPSQPEPGGEPAGPCVRAAVTVTIGLPKIGLLVEPGVRVTGRVLVEDIGFPRDLTTDPALSVNLLEEHEAAALLPSRDPGGHKGSFGRVLTLGGSPGMTGAAVLAARAATRSGAGLIHAAYPAPLGTIMESLLLEPVKHPLAGEASHFTHEHAPQALALAEGMDAVALGPGLGQAEGTAAFVYDLIAGVRGPLVLDADALNLLAHYPIALERRAGPTILTPHPGEAARLLGVSVQEVQSNRLEAFTEFARRYNAVVVLKGAQTIVTAPDGQRTINPTGNSALAKGGSGDVLTGLIAGLAAQGADPLHAALCGVFVHGLAADLLVEDVSPRGVVARDVIGCLPRAFARLERGPVTCA